MSESAGDVPQALRAIAVEAGWRLHRGEDADVDAVCGPRRRHDTERAAVGYGAWGRVGHTRYTAGARPALNVADLRAMPHHEQITQHFCIQGWSGIAKWGGVSMQTLIDLVQPSNDAKWVVFYSLGDGPDCGIYYDALPIAQMAYHLTMLAYDMNDEPLSFGHGAPLRLRNETQLGFKQVKWVKGVEFVAHYAETGASGPPGSGVDDGV